MEVKWNLAGWAGFVERPRVDRYADHVSRLDVQLAPAWNFHFFRGISTPRKMEVMWNLAGWAGFVERPRVVTAAARTHSCHSDRASAASITGDVWTPHQGVTALVAQGAAAWREGCALHGRAAFRARG